MIQLWRGFCPTFDLICDENTTRRRWKLDYANWTPEGGREWSVSRRSYKYKGMCVYFQQKKNDEGQGKEGVTIKLWWTQKSMKDYNKNSEWDRLGNVRNCCLLWIDKSRAKDKTYIWVSVWLWLEFGVKVVNMSRDNGLCVCVVKPHGVSDKPLGVVILQYQTQFTSAEISQCSRLYVF